MRNKGSYRIRESTASYSAAASILRRIRWRPYRAWHPAFAGMTSGWSSDNRDGNKHRRSNGLRILLLESSRVPTDLVLVPVCTEVSSETGRTGEEEEDPA